MKKRIAKILGVITVFVLVLILLTIRLDGDISSIYTTF